LPKPTRKPFTVLGTGVALPERVLTNVELEKMVDTSDAWIRERTGICERRIAAEGTATSDLAAAALQAACEDAAVEPASLDAIIVATSTPDTLFPSTACWTQRRLGAVGMAAFDVSAGCTGWLYGVELAAGLLASGAAQRVGVCGAEVMSRVVDWKDRATCVLFGDGAGAAVVAPAEDGSGMVASNWGADGNLAPILYQPAGGTRRPATEETVQRREHSVYMEGSAVFRHAVRAMASAAVDAMKAAGVGPDEVSLLIPHQANTRIIEATRSRTGVAPERVYVIVERYGNMSAAGIPVALHYARAEGRLKRGDLVVLTAFGTGLTWAAGVLRW
jgi:3-oxoacyl-[acyl-carrier-protein] synthase-3